MDNSGEPACLLGLRWMGERVTGAQWNLELERSIQGESTPKMVASKKGWGWEEIPCPVSSNSPVHCWAQNQWEAGRQWRPGDVITGASWPGHRLGLGRVGGGHRK